jgi:hypothetical protein
VHSRDFHWNGNGNGNGNWWNRWSTTTGRRGRRRRTTSTTSGLSANYTRIGGKKRMTNQQKNGWALLVVILVLLLWLLLRPKPLQADVTSRLVPLDPLTGSPVFWSDNPATFPNYLRAFSEILDALPPLGTYTGHFPGIWSCPIGYALWYDAAQKSYVCIKMGDANRDEEGAL